MSSAGEAAGIALRLSVAQARRRSGALGSVALGGLTLTALALGVPALGGCGGSARSNSGPASQASAVPESTRSTAAGPPTPAGVVTASAAGVTATMHAGTHHPKVGRAWPLHFTVTRGGEPADASLSYEFLFGGQVVARRSHYTFHGHFSDIVTWPSSAVGYPLILRAVLASGGTRLNLDYPVQVTR